MGLEALLVVLVLTLLGIVALLSRRPSQTELRLVREGADELRKRAAVAEQARDVNAARLGEVERELADRSARLEDKRAAATLLATQLEAATRELRAQESELATLRESLAQTQRQSDEKLELLQGAKEQLSTEFKLVASAILEKQSEAFTLSNKVQLDGLLNPLREKLGEFQLGLTNAHLESTRERATLAEQIRALTESSSTMSQETLNLTRALKGDSQKRGAWGELVLSKILEGSGLREGTEYTTQVSHTSTDGGRLRPDAVVMLPGDPNGQNQRQIIVDSKLSLVAFEAFTSAVDDAERDEHLARHVDAMRVHIKALSSKEYQRLIDGGLDYVIMFVPIEGALAAALQAEPTLTTFALEHQVMIATPTTLMLALRTVHNVWQVERRTRNAEEIAERAGKVYDKLVGFLGDLSKVGSRLGQARAAFDDAMQKLSTGQGNVLGQVEQLKEMGARTTKSIPVELLAPSELAEGARRNEVEPSGT